MTKSTELAVKLDMSEAELHESSTKFVTPSDVPTLTPFPSVSSVSRDIYPFDFFRSDRFPRGLRPVQRLPKRHLMQEIQFPRPKAGKHAVVDSSSPLE